MKMKLLGSALALSLVSTAATAGATIGNGTSDWTVYSWQNWTYEFTKQEDDSAVTSGTQKAQKIRNDAAQIGFKGSQATGLSMGGQEIKVNFQCEQFMQFGGGDGGDWCNRNSKISISGAFGEVMWGNWLTPYNEMLAGHIDPYWDADFTSHTSLMGTINSGDYTGPGGGPTENGAGIAASGFNKRQDSLVQYWSPNINGFHFRAATSTHDLGDIEITNSAGNATKLDPRLIEGGITYMGSLANGDSFFLGTTFSIHDEWAAVDFACDDSKDEGLRFAGNFQHQWGGGASTKIAAMWENIEYDWDGCGTSVAAMVSVGAVSTDLELEKDTWLVSMTHAFGNGWDVRGTYLDAAEYDCDTGCTTEDDTDATSYSLGMGYTTPAGTMFSLKYAHVDNEDNARYGTGFYPAGTVANGADSSTWGIGITHGF